MSTDDSLSRQLSQYVFRSILSTVGASIYVLADSFFVAKRMGVIGIAVMNLTMPLFNVMEGLGLLLGMGGGTLFTITRIKDKKRSEQIYTLILMIGIILGLVFTVLGIFFSVPISRFLGADSTTLSYTLQYVKVVLFFGPFFTLNNLLLSFSRNDNGTRIAMIAMIISSLTNIFLDWLFIIQLNMGMHGAGLATSFSPFVSILITLLHFKSNNNTLRIVKPHLDWKTIIQSFTIGLPSFLTEMSTGIGIFIYNWTFLKVSGNDAVAAYGIVANVLIVALALFTGVAQGIQPIISHCYAKHNFNSIKFGLRFGLMVAELLGFGCYLFTFFKSGMVINFFNAGSDAKVTAMAVTGLHILLLSLLLSCLNVVFNIFFSAINDSHISILMVILRGYILPMIIVVLCAHFGNLTAVWSSLILIEFISLILEIFSWILIRKDLQNNDYRI